jgi:hypothetical protein
MQKQVAELLNIQQAHFLHGNYEIHQRNEICIRKPSNCSLEECSKTYAAAGINPTRRASCRALVDSSQQLMLNARANNVKSKEAGLVSFSTWATAKRAL